MPYCSKCGADLPPNATFCAKCGAPATAGAAQPYRQMQPPYGYGYEKHEKREKDMQRNEKYEKREKGGDRSGPLVGGGILILLGIILYLTLTTPRIIAPSDIWSYFLAGIGIILIGQALFRYATSTHKGAANGSLFGGVILLAIGAGAIFGAGNFWPLLLIAIGVIIIVAGISARSRAPRP